MFRLTYSKQATKTLVKMPSQIASRIYSRMGAIAVDPYASHANVARLRDRDGYRLRVGDGRVIYEVEDAALVVLVLAIGPRGQVYRR